MLPEYLWHKPSLYLLLPPGSPHPMNPLPFSPMSPMPPMSITPGQHWKNARSYGSGWALLCCAMASKRLLSLVLSFSADQPIDLVYNELHPQWINSVESFLRQHRLRSLALTFTGKEQLTYLDSPRKEQFRYRDSPLRRPFTSLTSLSLKLRGTVADKSDNYDYRYKKYAEIEWEEEREKESWTITLDCPALQRLKLGRGKWGLEEGWAERFKSLRSLTLKHMDWSYVDLDYLATLTPQLTEFVLYHSWDFNRPSSGPVGDETFTFDLSKAQTVRFYFPHSTITLSLTLSSSLTTFTAMGKQLVLSCKSTEPLTLQHLLLYGQQRLVISSLRLASVRVAYLNGPPKDVHPRDDKFSSYLDFPELSLQFLPELSPDRESVHSSAAFSWAEWLRTIAPTVEVLIVRHGVPVEGVDAEWSSLRSLGIVVEREELFEVDLKVEKRRDDAATLSDPIDMLPEYLWQKVFRYLQLPPGSSYPETSLVRGRRKFPWAVSMDKNLPVRFADPDFTAAGQHWKNARSYGSGWALLCCAMASKRLLALVLSFSAHHPIDLVYNEMHPQWIKSVEFFLRQRHRLKSLALTFTDLEQLENLCSPLSQPFTSLSLKFRGRVDKSESFDDHFKDYEDEEDEDSWAHFFDCPALQRLKLSRGKWYLQGGWAEQYKSLRSLTLKHVDWSHVDMKNLGSVTPRLTEFVLYHGWSLDDPSSGPGGGGTFCFDLSKAQTVRFYFPHCSLTLSLTLSSSLTTFSAMAKQLVLSCKSTELLALHHLLLYGQQRLVISSLCLASVRVAYINGPPKDHRSRSDEYFSHLDFPELSPQASPELSLGRQSVHRRSSAKFSWVEWLRTIAPTVEVLIVRHGVPVEGVDAEWSSLRSLGIVVEREERFEVDLKVEKRRDDGEREVTVEEIQQRMELPETPMVHVRKARSGVPCACFAEKRPKNVREKMHSVNRELVDGYSVDKDEAYMLKYKGRLCRGSGGGSGSSGGSRAFYAPVVTPFEALMALEEGREWTGEYRMLPDGAGAFVAGHCPSIHLALCFLSFRPLPACARPCPLPTDAMGGPADGLGLGAEVNGGAESVADLLALPPDAVPRSELFFRLARAHFRAAVSASAGGPANPADPASSPVGGANDAGGGGDSNDNSSDEALALDVVRNAVQPSERPDHVPSLILASVICARRDTWSEEGVRYGERAVELAASSGPQRAKALHARQKKIPRQQL
ncbi:unnamed protein product [Closterium sp. NIES-65]|nr:unnamed protein product [Closterium sp. NIES-65]